MINKFQEIYEELKWEAEQDELAEFYGGEACPGCGAKNDCWCTDEDLARLVANGVHGIDVEETVDWAIVSATLILKRDNGVEHYEQASEGLIDALMNNHPKFVEDTLIEVFQRRV